MRRLQHGVYFVVRLRLQRGLPHARVHGKASGTDAPKVLLSVQPKGEKMLDAPIVLCDNDKVATPQFRLVSYASCMTQCVGPWLGCCATSSSSPMA